MFCYILKDLGRDIYDIYAEYENEEVEDRLPVSPSRLLNSPTKHFILNINVGGTVTPLNFCITANIFILLLEGLNLTLINKQQRWHSCIIITL